MSVDKRMAEEQDAFNRMVYCDRMAEDGDPVLMERADSARRDKCELEDRHEREAKLEKVFHNEEWQNRILRHLLIAGNILSTMPALVMGRTTSRDIGDALLEDVAASVPHSDIKDMLSEISKALDIKLPFQKVN